MSNQPDGKVAIFVTPEQLDFMIENCEKNEEFARNQLLAWSQMSRDEIETVKDSFIKIDKMKNQFQELRKSLEEQRKELL